MMIFFDEDPDARVCSRRGSVVTAADLQRRLDGLKKSRVGCYIVNMNAARANYPSRVIESYMDRPDAVESVAAAGFKALFSVGIDSNEFLVSGARKNGITPWLGFRMNDIHQGDDPSAPCHSEFWREHPELWCESVEFPCENTLDYSHEIVRRRMLDFIEEASLRYDADGIFLDWMRWPTFFPYGKGEERKGLLNDFMREVRTRLLKAEEKHGHPIAVAARVPLDIGNALKLGLDAVTWARDQLIDSLFIGNFFCGLETDAPVEKWHDAIGDRNFPVIVTINLTYAAEPPSGRMCKAMDDEVRGTAAAAYWRGASGVYLFNYMEFLKEDPLSELGTAALLDVASPDSLCQKSRRHRISWHDSNIRLSELDRLFRVPEFRASWQKKVELEGFFPASLPATLSPGYEKVFSLCSAWLPPVGYTAEMVVTAECTANGFEGLLNATPVLFSRREGNLFSARADSDSLKDGWTALTIKAEDYPIRLLEIFLDVQPTD